MTGTKRIHLKREPNLEAKKKAFPYQREAFESIKDLDYAAIFHEQGLGKTKIAIDLLLYWLDNTYIDTALIVTKKQLVKNWQEEFSFHTMIRPAVLDSNKDSNFYVYAGPSRVVITNFEVLLSDIEQMKLYLKTRNVGIIIDESAKLKNPKAKITQAFFELAPDFKKKVIMTGTPVANRPYDIWSQIFFLDQGKALGTDFDSFKRETDLSNDLYKNANKKEAFEKSISAIQDKIKEFTVRETKDSGIIELPAKVYIREAAFFEPLQREIYERIKQDLHVEIVKDGLTIEDDSSAIVKRLLRLVQVTSNPKLVDESFKGHSAKEIVLDELLQKIISGGEKCIVWSNFIENVNLFNKQYNEYGSTKIHGGMTIEERNKSVSRFKNESCKILFATPASAKEGLTLTSANHVIFYDRGFSLDDYLQAQDRIHRISQKKTCYVHNIIVENTIDEWIDLLLVAKENAAKLVQGDITPDTYNEVANYDFGEIVKSILSLEEE